MALQINAQQVNVVHEVSVWIVLDEPALRVSVADKTDQLFPMSRVSRVVCKGVVDWSISALLACADADQLNSQKIK